MALKVGKTLKQNWIGKARKSMERRGTVGSFTRAAKRAGMGVQQFARHVLVNKGKYSPAMRKKAGFAKAMSSIHRKKK